MDDRSADGAASSEGRLARVAGESPAPRIVAWLRGAGLLGGDRLVVEIGCGDGRLLRALSPEVEAVVGLDASALMCAEAREQTAGLDNAVVLQTSGRDLCILEDESADLLLALDGFPRILAAGLAEVHLHEAARVLAPGGDLVILDWRGGSDSQRDGEEVSAGQAKVQTPVRLTSASSSSRVVATR
jgi:SAM-dependent methyltransferase